MIRTLFILVALFFNCLTTLGMNPQTTIGRNNPELPCLFEKVPYEIIAIVLGFLDPKARAKTAQSCKHFNTLVKRIIQEKIGRQINQISDEEIEKYIAMLFHYKKNNLIYIRKEYTAINCSEYILPYNQSSINSSSPTKGIKIGSETAHIKCKDCITQADDQENLTLEHLCPTTKKALQQQVALQQAIEKKELDFIAYAPYEVIEQFEAHVHGYRQIRVPSALVTIYKSLCQDEISDQNMHIFNIIVKKIAKKMNLYDINLANMFDQNSHGCLIYMLNLRDDTRKKKGLPLIIPRIDSDIIYELLATTSSPFIRLDFFNHLSQGKDLDEEKHEIVSAALARQSDPAIAKQLYPHHCPLYLAN